MAIKDQAMEKILCVAIRDQATTIKWCAVIKDRATEKILCVAIRDQATTVKWCVAIKDQARMRKNAAITDQATHDGGKIRQFWDHCLEQINCEGIISCSDNAF